MLRSMLCGLALAAVVTTGHAADAPLRKACVPEPLSYNAAIGKLAACEAFVISLSESDPGWRVALEARIKLEQLAGHWETALSLLDVAVAHFPANEELRLDRIALAKGSPDQGKVMNDLEYLRQRGSDDPRFWYEYGTYQRMLGANDDAIVAYDKGLAREPNDPMLLLGRLYALKGLERIPEALAAADAVVFAAPHDRIARLERADLLLTAGRPEAAIEDIGAARALGPSGVDDTSLLHARAEVMLDKPKEALSDVDAALADPWALHDPEKRRLALMLRFSALEKLGDVAAADEALGRLLAAMDAHQLLRIQVLLKNLGWDDVVISGAVHPAMRNAMSACVFKQACGARLQSI